MKIVCQMLVCEISFWPMAENAEISARLDKQQLSLTP
jgi:hypothetical protein